MRDTASLEIEGVVLDERTTFTLGDLSRICGVDVEVVFDLASEGVIEPVGRTPAEWRFRGEAVLRVHRAVRLAGDLGLNLPGIALALDLLDELETLREGEAHSS